MMIHEDDPHLNPHGAGLSCPAVTELQRRVVSHPRRRLARFLCTFILFAALHRSLLISLQARLFILSHQLYCKQWEVE